DLNVFILSPQSITGGDRRFSRKSEFRSMSLEEYLRNANDLVVFVDEAHHLGSDDETAWRNAVDGLKPRLHFGLTATPKPNANVLYSYDIRQCLREGLYTKAVRLIADRRDEKMTDLDWDRHTIDYALQRLERKREAIGAHVEQHGDF